MKVLIINSYISGSTGKIARTFLQELKKDGHEAKLLYGAGEIEKNDRLTDDYIKISNPVEIKLAYWHNQISGLHGCLSYFAVKRIERIIEEFKPDIVQLYNLHFYYIHIYKLFELLVKLNIPVCYGMLDEYAYLGYCCTDQQGCNEWKYGCENCDTRQFRTGYPRSYIWANIKKTVKLKKRAYDSMTRCVYVAPEWVVLRAQKSYLLSGKNFKILDEFVDNQNIYFPRQCDDLRQELKISQEKKIVLNVALFSDRRKGIGDYIELARLMEENHGYVFLQIGFDGSQNDLCHLPSNYIAIPIERDSIRMAKYYSMADVLVCTSYSDTMPNVCLEAISCGTPVVGYDISGIPFVADKPIGTFVTAGDINRLKEAVEMIAELNISKECRLYSLERYSPECYKDKMLHVYTQLLRCVE